LRPATTHLRLCPAKTLDELAANPESLKAVLTFHVVPGKLAAAHIKNSNVKSLNGAVLAVSKAGNFCHRRERCRDRR